MISEFVRLPRGREVRAVLWVYLGCLAGFWCVALGAVAIQTGIAHRPYPYDTLLFLPAVRFSDFTIFYPKLAVYGKGNEFFSHSGFPFTYPAPLLVCLLGIWKSAPHPLRAYLLTVSGFYAAGICLAMKAVPGKPPLRRLTMTLVAATTLGSFPIFFLLDRANLEGFVWIAGSIGLVCFVSKRYPAAAIFLALAASMKLFPGVLFLLFLAKRRYREFALACVTSVVFTVASLWFVGPSLPRASEGIAMGVDFFRRTQILEFRAMEIGFDHSLFAWVKQVAFRFVHDVPRLNALLPSLYLCYAAFAVLAFGCLYFLRVRRMPVMNQLLALSALSVTLPFVSYEYTLVHLMAPFLVLVSFLVRDVATGRVPLSRAWMLALVLPYAVVFAPASFLLYHGFGFGGQVQAIALVSLIGTASGVRLPSTLFSELSDRMIMEFRLELTQLEQPEPARRV